MPARPTVAFVTLGCARNEVDPRSSPAGSRPTAGRRRGARAADAVLVEHVRVHRRRPSRSPSTSCSPPRTSTARPRRSSRWAAWPSGTAWSWLPRCPEAAASSASTTTPTSPRGCGRAGRRRGPSHTPRDRRTLLPIAPGGPGVPRAGAVPGHGGRAAAPGPRRDPRRPAWRRPPGSGAARAAAPPARPAVRSRRSRSRPAATGGARSARSPPSAARSCPGRRRSVLAEAQLAGRPGRARTRAGQRELDVLRQGPRATSGCWRAAARAGRGRRHRAGPGQLPPARRGAARR